MLKLYNNFVTSSKRVKKRVDMHLYAAGVIPQMLGGLRDGKSSWCIWSATL